MYVEHFSLTQRPFSSVPTADGCVLFPGFKHCLQRCQVGIGESGGPILVVGPPGTGKSTLLSLLQQEFEADLSVIMLNCAAITSRHELIQCLLYELQLPLDFDNVGESRLQLIDHLKSPDKCPNGLLLLVDEAHNLSYEVLEEMRMITNLICGGKHQIRLVIAGGQALEEKLVHSQLESFNQRIGTRCYLQPMTRDETIYFVLAQIQKAGRDGREIFEPSALEKIHDITDGVARLINQLCDQALKLALAEGLQNVDGAFVQNSWCDLQQLPMPIAAEQQSDQEINDAAASVIEFGSLDEPLVETEPASEIEPSTAIETDQLQSETLGDFTDSPLENAIETPAAADAVNESFDDLLSQLEQIQSPEQYADSNQQVVCSPDPEEHEKAELQAIADQNCEPAANLQTPTAEELFGQEFASEEQVIDISSDQLAEQNLNSSSLISADVASLQPLFDEPDMDTLPAVSFPMVAAQNSPQQSDNETADSLDLQSTQQEQETGLDAAGEQTPSVDTILHNLARQIRDNEQADTENPLPVDQPDSTTDFQDAHEDDRDMLVINQAKITQPTEEQSTPPHSTSHVIRMDYRELFQQLRSDSPSNES